MIYYHDDKSYPCLASWKKVKHGGKKSLCPFMFRHTCVFQSDVHPPILYSLLANNYIFFWGFANYCSLLWIFKTVFPFSFMLGVDRNCAKFESLKSPQMNRSQSNRICMHHVAPIKPWRQFRAKPLCLCRTRYVVYRAPTTWAEQMGWNHFWRSILSKAIETSINEQEPIESHLHALCCATYQTLETI